MTFQQVCLILSMKNPTNSPISALRTAELLWPDADWLYVHPTRHQGGATKGALVAASLLRRMAKKGLVRGLKVGEQILWCLNK